MTRSDARLVDALNAEVPAEQASKTKAGHPIYTCKACRLSLAFESANLQSAYCIEVQAKTDSPHSLPTPIRGFIQRKAWLGNHALSFNLQVSPRYRLPLVACVDHLADIHRQIVLDGDPHTDFVAPVDYGSRRRQWPLGAGLGYLGTPRELQPDGFLRTMMTSGMTCQSIDGVELHVVRWDTAQRRTRRARIWVASLETLRLLMGRVFAFFHRGLGSRRNTSHKVSGDEGNVVFPFVYELGATPPCPLLDTTWLCDRREQVLDASAYYDLLVPVQTPADDTPRPSTLSPFKTTTLDSFRRPQTRPPHDDARLITDVLVSRDGARAQVVPAVDDCFTATHTSMLLYDFSMALGWHEDMAVDEQRRRLDPQNWAPNADQITHANWYTAFVRDCSFIPTRTRDDYLRAPNPSFTPESNVDASSRKRHREQSTLFNEQPLKRLRM